ncbi:hypothetical protein DV515_00013679 [Chloebia gouldiae]|uniref:Uncharacterized protein n=1 Tax=Chloebia gouldiae TaxID=44316 RepID=A0A3L8S1K5_CHLGU|nr:hypothetical protein DV515_00013679 [Chloebia gouldiae]
MGPPQGIQLLPEDPPQGASAHPSGRYRVLPRKPAVGSIQQPCWSSARNEMLLPIPLDHQEQADFCQGYSVLITPNFAADLV